ncbi:helix-turn-helix domain-containing protein [Variovorax boronicumulans]|uniref:helix-turn-helix domain-containing protein n=1 Tax=Variovorax boronicumulans TaxID=436515 RepID=UPI003395925D
MDSLISASARALAAGDALGALKRVALRDDPPALALRGIAMAQLGEHPRARELLKRAARGFGAHEALARARCVVAEAEVALAMRDLGGSPRALSAAAATLTTHADHANALQARLIAARKLLLIGRLGEAGAALAALAALDAQGLSPSLAAVAELARAELALRSLHIAAAREALARAHETAVRARVPALLAEVAEARAALDRPAARRLLADGEQLLRLDEVAALLASDALVVDACRRGVGTGDAWRPLARRPVLFALARALAEAWPGDVDRDALIASAFRTRHPDETHRARLRVDIGRLRALVKEQARIEATARGFVLRPRDARTVAVLAPPVDGDQGALLALLSDGAAWSTSALALALDASQRTVQRALAELQADGRVRAIGRARAQRWLAPPLAGFTTILLLPSALPIA